MYMESKDYGKVYALLDKMEKIELKSEGASPEEIFAKIIGGEKITPPRSFYKYAKCYYQIIEILVNKQLRTDLWKTPGTKSGKINYSSLISFLDALGDANWEHLHQTEEEEKLGAGDWSRKVIGELQYIIDRVSPTRILRTHWFFLQLRANLENGGLTGSQIHEQKGKIYLKEQNKMKLLFKEEK